VGGNLPVRRDVLEPMGNIAVRAARAGDSPAIVDIHVHARRSYYEGHLPEAELVEWEDSIRVAGYADRIELPDRAWLVADIGGVVVGFALTTDAELLQLQVHPDHWGSGVGAALHAACVDVWRETGVRVAGLDVFEPNVRARRFYVCQGWREVSCEGDPPHVRMELDVRYGAETAVN
jgi:GNAT superfamily N-acetyltransferase